MTNPNGFSDSQESALFGDDLYDVLKKEIDCDNLPLEAIGMTDIEEEWVGGDEKTEEGDEEMQEGDEQMQEKFDINGINGHSYASQGKPLPTLRNAKDNPGHLNFQILFPEQHLNKHWVYSEKLDKVFIHMEQTLPLRIKCEPPLVGLFLRTRMVFEVDQYKNDPVQRCHNHMAPTNPSNHDIDNNVVKHVIRCMNSSSEHHEENGHPYILTGLPTPQPESQYVTMYFQFFCKNSCPSGMNRRPTEIVFTLEDYRGMPLGSRKLSVRVCSCPKRDKEKEEEAAITGVRHVAKRRKIALPSGKKLMPSFDTHVFNVQLDIVGKENYLAVMKYAFDIMAGQAAKTGQYEFYKPYMDAILRKGP